MQTPDGQRIRKRMRSPVSSKSGSQRWGEERARHLALHGDVKPSAQKLVPTLAEFAPEFLAYQATLNKASELRAKRSILANHLLPALGPMRLDAIDERVIDRYIVDKLRSEAMAVIGRKLKRPRTLKPKTVRNHLGVLMRLLGLARRYKLITSVPNVEWPEIEAQPFQYLDFVQADAFLRTAAEHMPKWQAFLLTAIRTGLRLGELRALRWQHVDLKRRIIRVESNYTDEGGFGSPKNGKPRDVPLAWDVADALRSHRHRRKAEALVFPGEDGGVLSRHPVAHVVRRVGKLAGLDHLHPHALRHTFASHCVMRGVPLRQVQEWLGHATLDMTMRYSHLSPMFGAEAIDRLAGPPPKGSGVDVE